MKRKIISSILLGLMTFSLASCTVINKTTDTNATKTPETNIPSKTETSDVPGSTTNVKPTTTSNTPVTTTSGNIPTTTTGGIPTTTTGSVPTTTTGSTETTTSITPINEHTVSFYSDGGLIDTKTVKDGEKVSAIADPVKESDGEYNYTFDCWYYNNAAFNFNTEIKENIVLTAKWNKTNIQYDFIIIDSISNSQIYSTKVNAKSKATEPTLPAKNGYTFIGFYTDTTYTTTYSFDTVITKKTTIYAKYESSSSSSDVLNISSYSGYTEGAYIEIDKISGLNSANDYKVYYKGVDDNDYVQINSNLVRIKNSVVRADILGLKAGKYTIKVEANTQIQERNVTVEKDDRSGYAHFNYSDGVGAYNNDGTLKTNATVVYVSEATKNTVTATINNKTYTGIANIITAATNENYPLDVRIIGTIGAATWSKNSPDVSGYSTATTTTVKGLNGEYLALSNYDEAAIISGGFNQLDESIYTKLNGLTNKIKYDSSKKEFDSYYNMLDVKGAKNVTVEGVGTDAMLFQWGFTWKSDCKSIEIKNLTFDDYTEDACSFEGPSDQTSINAFTSTRYWLHNNTFNRGMNYWDVCSEQDKGDGDGATDFKRCAYVTLSYNHYYNNHKTGLVGGGDDQMSAAITFHHNFYDQCQARLPFARQANLHMYNNYYYKSSGNNMQIYAGAYAFIENSYFENISKTFILDARGKGTPAVKSYNNIFNSASSTGATIVTDRTATVTNDNVFGQTFDTDSSIFYYDSVNKCSDVEIMTNTEDVKDFVPTHAGAGNLMSKFEEVDEEALSAKKVQLISDLTNAITNSNGAYYSYYQNNKAKYDALITQYTDLINSAKTEDSATNYYNQALVECNNLTKTSYTVTFIVNGNTYETVDVYDGDDLVFPSSPTISNKLFKYWTLNGEKYTGEKIKADTTLTAVFTSNLNYSTLSSAASNIIAWDFNNSTEGQKLSSSINYSQKNVYGTSNNTNDTSSTNCYGEYTGSAIKTVDNDASGAAILTTTLGNNYDSGIVSGYVDLSLGANIGSKWKLLTFYSNTNNQLTEKISFGLDSNKNFAYCVNGGDWISFTKTLSGAANTTYSIYYQFDLDNGTVSLIINNVIYLDYVKTGIDSVASFQTMTNSTGLAGSKERVITLDNIAITIE